MSYVFLVCRFERRQIFKTYRLSEKGVGQLEFGRTKLKLGLRPKYLSDKL
jgi:hypothetical protein